MDYFFFLMGCIFSFSLVIFFSVEGMGNLLVKDFGEYFVIIIFDLLS